VKLTKKTLRIEVLKKWVKEERSGQIKPSTAQRHEPSLGKPESKCMKIFLA